MERVIENYIKKKRDSVTTSKLFSTKIEKPLISSIDDYLSSSSDLFSLIKKHRDQ